MVRCRRPKAAAVLVLLALAAGCATAPQRNEAPSTVGAGPAQGVEDAEPIAVGRPTIATVGYQAPVGEPAEAARPHAGGAPSALPAGPIPPAPLLPAMEVPPISSDDPCDPFAGHRELSLERLVTEVQARNPSLQAASAAWRAAAERYPQVVALDDPMLSSMFSPSGVGMDDGGGWMVQASQQVPWPGKRAIRGSVAAAEADARRGDIGDTRLRLAEAARLAYFDYYLAHRQAEVNQTTRVLVEQLRETAANKYQVGQVSQQDVLQAEVELADLATRNAELVRDREVSTARINTLLHRAPDHPLPPPPEAPLPNGLADVETLQQRAVYARPDLYAQLARIRTEEGNLALASKDYYPDLNLVARYDGFMPEEMRPQVGIDVNVPVRHARRSAAVREACHRLAQRKAEYEDALDRVRYEVQSAFTRVRQAAEVVRLYREQTLPAAENSLRSAQANYTTGTLDFLRLLDAERQLNNQRERYYTAVADYHRRLAELERAVGEPAG